MSPAYTVGLTDDTINMQAACMQLHNGRTRSSKNIIMANTMTQCLCVEQDATMVGLSLLDSMLPSTSCPVYKCTEAGEPDLGLIFSQTN